MRAWRRRSSSAARAELGARGEGGAKGSAGGVKAERVRLAAGRAPLQARQRAAWSELAGRVADTRRASPDAVRTWRGDGHGAREKKARRAEAGRAGAARGWAEARWVGTVRGQAGPPVRLGRKRGGGPRRRKTLFHLYFQELFKSQLSNLILSKKMTSFENVPKMKVA